MVLYAQVTGLTSLQSPSRPWSRASRKFPLNPNSCFLSSSSCLLPAKISGGNRSFSQFCGTIRGLSVSAAAAKRRKHVYAKREEDLLPLKPAYEHSIFLHILDKYPPAKKPLKPEAPGLENQRTENVGGSNTNEDFTKEEIKRAAEDFNELRHGGGKEENKSSSGEQFASSGNGEGAGEQGFEIQRAETERFSESDSVIDKLDSQAGAAGENSLQTRGPEELEELEHEVSDPKAGESSVAELTSATDSGSAEVAFFEGNHESKSGEVGFRGWNFGDVDPKTEHFPGKRPGLKVGRQVFLTGEQDYNRWMPNSEVKRPSQGHSGESSREEQVLHLISQNGGSEISLLARGEGEVSEKGDQLLRGLQSEQKPESSVETATASGEFTQDFLVQSELSRLAGDGQGEVSEKGEEKETGLQMEETALSSTDINGAPGEEIKKDLLIEFLKKRSEEWRDPNIPDILKTNASGRDIQPESTNEVSGEAVLPSSGEFLSTQADVKSDVPTGLIQEIVSIARNLQANSSLEDFLNPFCGQVSTRDGNLLLRYLGENRFTWPMLSFFQWMRVHEPCLLDSRSFCTLFTCLGRLGMVDQALLQYKNMPEDAAFHCVQVYNSLLGALSRCGRAEKVNKILQEMENRKVERDSFTWSILIAATKGSKDRKSEVWSIFDDLLREGVKPNVAVYGSLIKALCDEGHLKQALLLSLNMEKMGISPNVVIYNTLIDAHAKASQLEEAEGLLVEMRHRNLRPTESTYNALINGYGRSGQLNVAEELVLEMQHKEGLKPNVVTYTSLISAYGKHLSSEKAMNAFLRMKKVGLTPNTQTYTAVINAFAEGGWHEKGQGAFDEMVREGLTPTVETYTALLDGYRRAGDVDMVRHVWNQIKEDGCELTRITYRTILDAFSKHGHYVEARDVVDEFRRRGIQPDTMTYNMLLNAYARGGVSTKLRKVLLEMQDAGCEPDSYTYCTLIYSFIRVRDFTSAFKYDAEMLEKGLLPDRKIYGKMRFILDSKYAEKLENDKKSVAGQNQNSEALEERKAKNPQRAKTQFKRYKKRGPRRGSERMKALWKDKEEQKQR